MSRGKAATVEVLVDTVRAGAVPTVFTTGFISRFACAVADPPHHFYMVGSMGMALPLGAGIALATGRPTLVVDGDGALAMNPAALVTAAQVRAPVVHVVLDDAAYDSTGGQPTGVAPGVLPALAEAAGYPDVRRIEVGDDLPAVLSAALKHAAGPDPAGPVMLHIDVVPDRPVPSRITRPLPEVAARFGAAVTAS
ncbi:thiamine pyrophosphate-dependent enzyme [Nocardioides speluncae]|uniref:thiamine pyrophosphate-dependent enzyme n=1 Tax=Nocardioides speluncae TaxID=2670337 RepID=UPI0012B182E8|nr:thiamine pyrophosphate-dependent enzyme [Nocardioides speluncae]